VGATLAYLELEEKDEAFHPFRWAPASTTVEQPSAVAKVASRPSGRFG